MLFFTGDEHYFHAKVIEYCHRPFNSVEEMNSELIRRFNEKVGKNDITIHAGDFSFGKKEETEKLIKKLHGQHIFLKGCHDYWLPKNHRDIFEKRVEGRLVVASHYPLCRWKGMIYGSWLLYAHTHEKDNFGANTLQIGVDIWNFYPISWEEVKENIGRK